MSLTGLDLARFVEVSTDTNKVLSMIILVPASLRFHDGQAGTIMTMQIKSRALTV